MNIKSLDDVAIRTATNRDVDRVIALVFSVLSEFGLPADRHSKDSDLTDIESNYIELCSNKNRYSIPALRPGIWAGFDEVIFGSMAMRKLFGVR